MFPDCSCTGIQFHDRRVVGDPTRISPHPFANMVIIIYRGYFFGRLALSISERLILLDKSTHASSLTTVLLYSSCVNQICDVI